MLEGVDGPPGLRYRWPDGGDVWGSEGGGCGPVSDQRRPQASCRLDGQGKEKGRSTEKRGGC